MKSDQHPLIAINKKTLDIHNKQTGRHLTAIPSPQGGSGGRTHVQARHHGHEPLRPERLQTRQPPRPTLRNAPRASSTSAVSLPESRLDKTNDTSLTCNAKIMAASMTTNPATKEAMTNHDQSPAAAAADNSGLAFSINSRARTIAIGVGITATSSIILDAVHSDALVYRETLTNKTFTGFAFEGMGVDPATIAGPGAILRRVSVNATLNASVAYTYADDLAFYLDIPPLSTAGRLQIGGFSNLSATTRLSWPNGGSNAPGATVSGSIPRIPGTLLAPLPLISTPTFRRAMASGLAMAMGQPAHPEPGPAIWK